jgi:hypothetical protein
MTKRPTPEPRITPFVPRQRIFDLPPSRFDHVPDFPNLHEEREKLVAKYRTNSSPWPHGIGAWYHTADWHWKTNELIATGNNRIRALDPYANLRAKGQTILPDGSPLPPLNLLPEEPSQPVTKTPPPDVTKTPVTKTPPVTKTQDVTKTPTPVFVTKEVTKNKGGRPKATTPLSPAERKRRQRLKNKD